MKVSLSTALLAGALEASAKSDVRYYLNGVLVDFVNKHEVVIVGTDGHILFAAKQETDEHTNEGLQLIIPREVVEAALKAKSASIELTDDTREGSAMYFLGNSLFTPVEGRFPEYTRVIPSKLNGEAGFFDAALLARAHLAVAKAHGTKKLQDSFLYQNGLTGTAIVQGAKTYVICVVMPYRHKDAELVHWEQPIQAVKQAA